ncbi:myosin light chain kinase 2, skeletal/cardiac muscle isoform X1 [Cyprinodon tularosa]|uniref:myosin light chain kinase 2, skeletal/cardiac muscle isoform X1 n=1 Tax=Cyprinodon tularosa TaxID=77115 RepID=UPI0018E20515|nr:myosin light chain kinase 2, skeletal/cardiac muscle isoform X1 [Cyprinodon tularosa]
MSSLVIEAVGESSNAGFDIIQNRIESLSGKMDKLIHIQEKVLSRLDGMSQEIDDIEQDMEQIKVDKEEIHLSPKVMNQTQVMGREVHEICQEMSTIMSVVNQRSEQQAQKLEGMEKLVLSMQQVISFIGETVKCSKVMQMMFKGPATRKVSRNKDSKGRQATKRKASPETVTKKPDKKTTSNKANKGKQKINPACQPSSLRYYHRIKPRGPKHFLASRKCGNLVKDQKVKDGAEKPCLSQKGLKAQKKMKPPDAADSISPKKQALLLEEVQKLNKENTEKSSSLFPPLDLEAGGTVKDEKPELPSCNLVDYVHEENQANVAEEPEVVQATEEQKDEEQKDDNEVEDKAQDKAVLTEIAMEKSVENKAVEVEEPAVPEEPLKEDITAAEVEVDLQVLEEPASYENKKEDIATSDDHKDITSCAETEQDQLTVAQEENKDEKEEQNKEDEEDEQRCEDWAIFKADGVAIQLNLKEKLEKERKEHVDENKIEDDQAERFFIDTTPPPAAPFNHRIVSAKPNQIRNFYTINWQEVLGGGRFGQVHKCVENSSGLTLAAKVIKARSQKEKEVVKNEIQVMNNLDHANLIQLYAAYESRNDIILVLEYVGGGELFDRIIDENYTLMELDAVVFIRQICDGLQYMHKMSVLHLDLKPENILCVSRVTNKVKIIDFGLARIYKPREKLKVNFGTPEFLAPEVINYDFVSFNTDMWSLGVITYMLLSGLCPFLGDDDNQTLNNILACQWNFEEQEFSDTSAEAKDFITRLLVTNKTWRMGASEALRHPWLSDPVLHHRLYTKKTMCRSRRSSCAPLIDI